VEHRQHGGRFERGAVIAMQDGLGLIGCDALGKRGPLYDAGGVIAGRAVLSQTRILSSMAWLWSWRTCCFSGAGLLRMSRSMR